MKDAQKPDHVSLNTLIARLKEGRFVIPDFQREFEWRPWDIRDLVRSIFLDYYIGSLLLWKGKKENFEALSCEAVYGHVDESRPEYIVLDGQSARGEPSSSLMREAFLAPIPRTCISVASSAVTTPSTDPRWSNSRWASAGPTPGKP